MLALQSFCKANCFCKSDKNAYGGIDPAIKASGGCYHSARAGLPFRKARNACSREGGALVSIHDKEKGRFLNRLMSKWSANYWIGNSRSDDSVWRWEDQSTHFYTHWDVNEPSTAAVAKCAYVNATSHAWAAGNCQMGLPFVCQHAPCSVGNNYC